MADVKVSGLPNKSTPAAADYVVLNDATGPTTKRTLLSALATFFFNQVNIPDGTGSPRTRMTETMFDHVASGMVWSGDAYASTRNASMTAGTVYINGRRISIAAVTARTFVASVDTYIDVLDNGDGTGSLVYTTAVNNAASPALAANSIRIGIIVTGATTIAAVGSVNQGQETKVLPIASSIPYAVTDSLGNLICPRDPNRRLLGYRQLITDFTSASTSYVDVTGLNMFVNLPTNPRKLKAIIDFPHNYNGGGGTTSLQVLDVTGGSALIADLDQNLGNTVAVGLHTEQVHTPPAGGARNYKLQFKTTAGTYHSNNSSQSGASVLKIEQE